MADVELLPLPWIERYSVVGDIAYPVSSDPDGDYVAHDDHTDAMQAYARANVAHATAPLQAEVDALRAEVERLKHHAERLEKALRLALNSHGKTLLTDPPQDAWKVNRVEEIGRALLRDQEEGHEQ